MKRKLGKLIVIDGGDGSGKATQAKLLISYLRVHKYKATYVDFPQYHKFHGKIVGKFLSGEFGPMDQLSPYLVSYPYALDRYSAKEKIQDAIENGEYVIANRYTSSHMGHQTSRFSSLKEQDDYLRWVQELEYKRLGMPKEDIVVHLHVPWKIGYELTNKKISRKYLKGENLDIAEKDMVHREQAEHMYEKLSKKFRNWVQIECVYNDKLLSVESIHQMVLEVLRKRKLI